MTIQVSRILPFFCFVAFALPLGCRSDSRPLYPDAGHVDGGSRDSGMPLGDAGPAVDAGPRVDSGPGVDGGPGEVCGDLATTGTETCDGEPCCNDTCDGLLGAGTTCRSSAGACDVDETCDGFSSAACPADAFAAAGTTCIPSTGVCDPAEVCTGSSVTCPSDALAPAGTMCRPSAGACDVAESCTGASGACPADGLAGASTVCRPAASGCDTPDRCSGSSPSCPADATDPDGTSCTDCSASACAACIGGLCVDGVGLGTVVINELDCDQFMTDAGEFIELWDGGRGSTSLTGLILVLYNGSSDVSYSTIDLAGQVTDARGYFVIGNAGVPGVDFVTAGNTLQNGEDGVGLYMASAASFPSMTAVTSTGLLDAVVYDTDDADDLVLLSVLTPGEPQVNEAGAGDGTITSIQRAYNGAGGRRVTTYWVPAAPTPDAPNSP